MRTEDKLSRMKHHQSCRTIDNQSWTAWLLIDPDCGTAYATRSETEHRQLTFLRSRCPVAAPSLVAAPAVDRREPQANYEPAFNVSWKSVPPSVPNNGQSKIHKIAHKRNDRRMATSAAHPIGPYSRSQQQTKLIALGLTIRRGVCDLAP